MVDQKKEHQKSLAQLVCDLKTKKSLCRVRDYPAITLDELNQYLEKHGPLDNPVFGEQPAFFVDDDGYFTPYRMVVYDREKVVGKIARLVDEYATWSGYGGRMTPSQGAFVLEQRTEQKKVRMPDVAYTPRNVDRNLSDEQRWTYRGEPFVPSFVVEVDKLTGEGSERWQLDRKMRYDYFRNGVQLGWLIDPDPDHQIMYEYYLDEHGEVQCSNDRSWRDLDGGNVLPGFVLHAVDLEMVLNQESGSSSEDEVDFACPERGCRKRFRSRGAWTAHAEDHRAERTRQKYLASRES